MCTRIPSLPSRLRLIPATQAMISAELDGKDRLAALLDAVLPSDLEPSLGVLRRLGFEPSESPIPDVVEFRLRRA